MNTIEAQIKIVSDKLLQLLKRNTSLQKENEILSKEIIEFRKKEKDYLSSIFSLNQKISILKTASGSMTEADQREFEKRIDKYVKELDKCIGMLSE